MENDDADVGANYALINVSIYSEVTAVVSIFVVLSCSLSAASATGLSVISTIL